VLRRGGGGKNHGASDVYLASTREGWCKKSRINLTTWGRKQTLGGKKEIPKDVLGLTVFIGSKMGGGWCLHTGNKLGRQRRGQAGRKERDQYDRRRANSRSGKTALAERGWPVSRRRQTVEEEEAVQGKKTEALKLGRRRPEKWTVPNVQRKW